MGFDLETIRAANPIEAVVAEKFTLRKSGVRFVGIEHDSLVVIPASGFYFWNSRGEYGDAFDFVGVICCPTEIGGTTAMSRNSWNQFTIWRSGLVLILSFKQMWTSHPSGQSVNWCSDCTRHC